MLTITESGDGAAPAPAPARIPAPVYELVAVREPADDEPMAMRDSLIKDGGAALKQRERWVGHPVVELHVALRVRHVQEAAVLLRRGRWWGC